MVEVKIPFMDRFRKSMITGTKTWTSRSKKYGNPDDTFKAFGYIFIIEKVERRTLADVATHYLDEGCSSEEDFIEVWKSLHRRKGFDPFHRVYVHVFSILGFRHVIETMQEVELTVDVVPPSDVEIDWGDGEVDRSSFKGC